MHTLDKQIELYILLHNNGYLTALSDINEMTEQLLSSMQDVNILMQEWQPKPRQLTEVK